MFRGGGKVSSYGNGIASGLVNKPKRGLVDEPGGYAGVTGAQISEEALAKIMGKRGTLLGDVNRGLTKGTDFLYNAIARPLGNLPYMASDYVLGTEFGSPIKYKNSFEEYLDAFGGADKILGADRVTDVDMPPGGGETRLGSGEAVYDAPKKEEKSLEEIMAGMLGKKDTRSAKEQIAENKELFEEVMGGGKDAMIDDLSTMGLSFAGKALKEGATTKSAFSEFFEEESKRPSRKAKVSDAASNAAIQAYLTGEKSYNDLMKALKVNQAGIDYKANIEKESKKALTITDYVLADKSGSSNKAIANGARKVIENNNLGTQGLQIISKEDAADEKLLTKENEGEVFMDEDNQIVFMVVDLGNGEYGKKVLYN